MKTDKVRLSRFIRDLKLSEAETNSLIELSVAGTDGEHWLTQETINTFLEQYTFNRNIVSHDNNYSFSDEMESSSSPWLLTLKKLYQMPVANPASLSPAQGELLKAILANISAKTVVEIGCYIGISTLWLAAGMASSTKRGRLYAIDTYVPKFPWPPFHYSCIVNPKALIVQAIESSGFSDIIHLVESDSKNAASHFDSWLGHNEIDLLFIDGDHSISGCTSDFELYAPLVAVGGYIIFHDVFPAVCGHEGPRFVLDNFIMCAPDQYQFVEMLTAPTNYGIAIVRKLRE
ncbi:class I SAM-dependent methyltransferase [Rheinheimera sp. D18]|uniref:O-methyltransferase n=1 Tax=Rheinheimera sp. D18 TaxID=2545632 RepID=UPI00104B38FB|nr:class I SAM-dependent methyltransferase [Rheinheimera sp. D18]QBL09897.1 class I SAM-dependent methyltransferase [Rheinheimera sp. D18]